jgi:hypothetical protein
MQTAMAVGAFAPDMTCFKRGRDFSAWLGLVPKQHSTGGKNRLGRVSKMGQADIRSQLIRGAMSVTTATTRFGIKRGLGRNACLGATSDLWLQSRLPTEWRGRFGRGGRAMKDIGAPRRLNAQRELAAKGRDV